MISLSSLKSPGVYFIYEPLYPRLIHVIYTGHMGTGRLIEGTLSYTVDPVISRELHFRDRKKSLLQTNFHIFIFAVTKWCQ